MSAAREALEGDDAPTRLEEMREESRRAFQARADAVEEDKERAVLAEWDPFLDRARTTRHLLVAWHALPYVNPAAMVIPDLLSFKLVGLNLFEIPDAFGEHHEGITSVSFANNRLVELPPSLFRLTRLVHLDVLHNKLPTLPDALCSLTRLTELQVQSNRLRRLPADIGSLMGIRRLTLDCNELVELPESLGSLSLRTLSLNKNALTSVPSWFCASGARRQPGTRARTESSTHAYPSLSPSRDASSSADFARDVVPERQPPAHLPGVPDRLPQARGALAGLEPRRDRPARCGQGEPRCGRLYSCRLDLFVCAERHRYHVGFFAQFTQLKALSMEWNFVEALPLEFAQLATTLQTLRLDGNPLRRPTLKYIVEHGPKGMYTWADQELNEIARMRIRGAFARRTPGARLRSLGPPPPLPPRPRCFVVQRRFCSSSRCAA